MGLLRSKKSYAMEIATKPLVMASEIAGSLPCMDSSSRRTGSCQCASRWQRNEESGRSSSMPELISSLLPEAAVPKPVAASPPAPLKKAAAQSVLPLPAPAVKPKGVYVWNESKGID